MQEASAAPSKFASTARASRTDAQLVNRLRTSRGKVRNHAKGWGPKISAVGCTGEDIGADGTTSDGSRVAKDTQPAPELNALPLAWEEADGLDGVL